eukprot:148124-Pelagomonas_calceolata.AAC.16
MARLVEGMSSLDSPTHTQEDCVESDLCTLKLFAWFCVVAVRLLTGHQASYLCRGRGEGADALSPAPFGEHEDKVRSISFWVHTFFCIMTRVFDEIVLQVELAGQQLWSLVPVTRNVHWVIHDVVWLPAKKMQCIMLPPKSRNFFNA